MTSPTTSETRAHVLDARTPGALRNLGASLSFPAVVGRHRELLFAFVRRDLASRFQGSVLGVAWPLLQPLLLFALFYFVFGKVLRVRYEGVGLPEPVFSDAFFGVWLFLGVLLWNAFSQTIGRSVTCLLEQGHLLKKAAFPSELLPFSIALAEGVVLLVGLAVLLVAVLALGLPLRLEALLFPLVLLGLLSFVVGISLAVCAFHVFVRDTANFVSVGLLFWMFLTPVFWQPEHVEAYAPWPMLNPMYHALGAARDLLLLPLGPDRPVPFASMGIVLGSGLVTFVAGYAVFLGLRPRFVDET
jgi:lipopolysaccharide transport system permease protein